MEMEPNLEYMYEIFVLCVCAHWPQPTECVLKKKEDFKHEGIEAGG